jgi:hypothetical protein
MPPCRTALRIAYGRHAGPVTRLTSPGAAGHGLTADNCSGSKPRVIGVEPGSGSGGGARWRDYHGARNGGTISVGLFTVWDAAQANLKLSKDLTSICLHELDCALEAIGAPAPAQMLVRYGMLSVANMQCFGRVGCVRPSWSGPAGLGQGTSRHLARVQDDEGTLRTIGSLAMLLKTMGKLGTLSVRICTQSTAWHIPLHMQPLPRPVASILCSSPAVRVRSAVCLRISRERSAVSLSASQPAEMVRVPAMLKILAALQATSPALASTQQRACSVTHRPPHRTVRDYQQCCAGTASPLRIAVRHGTGPLCCCG